MRHGADINAFGSENYAPLHVAVKRSDKALVACLISHGVDVNLPSRYELKRSLQVRARLKCYNTAATRCFIRLKITKLR